MGLVNNFLFLIIIFLLVGGGTFVGFVVFLGDDSVPFLADEKYNSVTFSNENSALEKADKIGCEGFHTHEQENETIYMACENHADLDPLLEVLN